MKRIRQQQSEIDIQLIDKLRKRVKIDYQKQSVTLLKQQLSQKSYLQQQCKKYISMQQPIKTAMKSIESNGKKSKKLLGGYEKLIKTKIQEVNNLNQELQSTTRQRLVLEQMRKLQRRSIVSRFQHLSNCCKEIYKVV